MQKSIPLLRVKIYNTSMLIISFETIAYGNSAKATSGQMSTQIYRPYPSSIYLRIDEADRKGLDQSPVPWMPQA